MSSFEKPHKPSATPNDEELTRRRNVSAETRSDENPDEMPGGTASYAGRGDTETDSEAPGGTEGYAGDRGDREPEAPMRRSAKTNRDTRLGVD